jgi:membrane protease subunit (stomatin/prohibitin family)
MGQTIADAVRQSVATGSTPAAPTSAGGGAPAAAAGDKKFCMHCGKQIPRAAAFCPECGKPQQ